MIKTNFTIESWLSKMYPSSVHDIMNNRLGASSILFLKNKKLVTNSFSTPFSFTEFYLARNEVLRFFKIFQINLRKKFPLLKLGNEAYEVPFTTVRPRYYWFDVLLDASKVSNQTIDRYFRLIKINQRIVELGVPIRITAMADHTSGSDFSIIHLIRIRIEPSFTHNTNNEKLTTLFILIFYIPVFIKILSTLHKKAYFSNGNRTTTTSSETDNEIRDAV